MVTITYIYKYIHTHIIYMNTSERLSQFNLKIYEVGHYECFVVDGNIIFH
jgi:hypothetical protein